MAKLGILFDIDALGGGLYGYAAYKVLFGAIDSRQLAGCALYDGDTDATLRGGARQYCIAIDSSNPKTLDLAKKVISESKEPGLLRAAARFMTDATVRSEPLVLATSISSSGDLVGCKTGWVASAHKESVEKWRTIAQKQEAQIAPPKGQASPTTAQRQEAQVAPPKSKWWHFWK